MLFLVAQTFFLLVVATVVGVAAGWLIWGGSKRSGPTAAVSSPATSLTAELESSQAEIDARTADVARLRRKLKRAVEELERHALQLEAAEEHIAALSSGQPLSVVPTVLGSPESSSVVGAEELAAIQSQLADTKAAHGSVTDELVRVRTEHAAVSDQLRSAETRAEGLETGMRELRLSTTDDRARASEAAKRVAELELELGEARNTIRDSTARSAYLEQQALLWQNEADRLQAVLDAGSIAQAHEVNELKDRLLAVQRDHGVRVEELSHEVSKHRGRADASAERLVRLQSEMQTFRERSQAYLEASRSMMADLDRQLAAPGATLNDGASAPNAPTSEREVMGDSEQGGGLESLPGVTTGVLRHLRELGVSSLAEVARWTPDDVVRISSWLPEAPGIIDEHNWVEAARSFLAKGPVAATNVV